MGKMRKWRIFAQVPPCLRKRDGRKDGERRRSAKTAALCAADDTRTATVLAVVRRVEARELPLRELGENFLLLQYSPYNRITLPKIPAVEFWKLRSFSTKNVA
jgi:hypothetical protein